MFTNGIVDGLPYWSLLAIIILIVLLSIEAGWRIGKLSQGRNQQDDLPSIGIVVGSTLGLLSFLLAFTFGMAASRYDQRKSIIVSQANAIGTVYLRTDFLQQPMRDDARHLLVDYVTICAGGVNSIMSPEGKAKIEAIHEQLWALGSNAIKQSNSISVGLFMQSLNDMIDLDTTRITANRNTLPDTIWIMLSLVTIFSMISLGYEFGIQGARNWVVIILLIIVFTAVTILIADLDRPQRGFIQVSQQPLIDLLNQIRTN